MPEGDTVFRAVGQLRAALEDKVLTATDFRVPRFATLDLAGRTVSEVLSRGKHLLIRTDEFSIHTHLKMEGVWHVYGHGDRWRRPAHQARVVLETDDVQAVGFALGITEVLPRSDDGLQMLGPDLLGPDWDLAEATRRVSADGERPIFLALHDQANVAGFGNVYVNEICFLSGLDPARPVAAVPDVSAVIERGRRTILANRDRPERVFTGVMKPGQMTWVYGRDGKPCRRCRTRIKRSELGDTPTSMRNTFWCPHCQR
jgi:endonuclease-8